MRDMHGAKGPTYDTGWWVKLHHVIPLYLYIFQSGSNKFLLHSEDLTIHVDTNASVVTVHRAR